MKWITLNAAARRLGTTRWRVVMMCLQRELEYRPSAQGIELSERDVARKVKAVTAAVLEAQ